MRIFHFSLKTPKLISIFLHLVFFLVLLLPSNMEERGSWYAQSRLLINLFATIGVMVLLLHFAQFRKLCHWLGWHCAKIQTLPLKWVLGWCALFFFILTCTLSGLMFQHLPHIPDSQLHYIFGKIFASGHFTIPQHPLQQFFPLQYRGDNENYSYSSYPPGHTFFIALGTLIGLPWITNPLLGAAFVITVYYLGQEVGNRNTGLIAVALTLVCPYVIFMSSEFMSYSTTLLMVTLFLLFYLRMLKQPRSLNAILAGACLGYVGITRPHCAALLLLFFTLHAAWTCWHSWRRYLKYYMIICGIAALFFLFYLYYNWITTGSAFLTGYEVVQGFTRKWVTSSKRLFNPWIDFRRATIQSGALSVDFFCWPVPSFLLMSSLFLFRLNKGNAGILFFLFITFFSGLYIFIVHDIQIFSARFLYESSGAVIVLSALMIQRLPALARCYLLPNIRLYTWSGAFILMFSLFTVNGLFNRTAEFYHAYSNHYYLGNTGYAAAILKNVSEPALVFVDKFYYVTYTLPTEEDAPVIFAKDMVDGNKPLMDYYSGRHVYVVAPFQQGDTSSQPQSIYSNGGCISGLPRYSIRQIR